MGLGWLEDFMVFGTICFMYIWYVIGVRA